MPNIKNAAWYSGGLCMDIAPGAGNVYYVYGIDGGIGADTNTGLTPAEPLLTLTAALAKCTSGNQDYIIVMDYWQPTGEVWPITITKNNVHIIGYDGGGTQMPIITPTGDTAGVLVAADRIEIARMCINGGATHGCIENDPTGGAGRWGTLIRDCWFSVLGTAQDGIRNVGDGDNVYLTVKRCRFGFAITRDGIRIEFNATRCQIGTPWGDGNLFDRVAGIGVNVTGNAADVGIYNNIFVLPSDTAGKAITLSAGTAGSAIFGNHANFGDADMVANPYTDGAAGDSNTWGLNYKGVTATLPA